MSLLSSSASALCELYDLIVAEPDLPGMSGYALCSWYKQVPPPQTPPPTQGSIEGGRKSVAPFAAA